MEGRATHLKQHVQPEDSGQSLSKKYVYDLLDSTRAKVLQVDAVFVVDAEKISHFIVEWIESDAGAISLVPREKIASDPPYSVGNTVIVKFADKKGVRVTEKAIIRSQGREINMLQRTCSA